jgi:hypothetical protein
MNDELYWWEKWPVGALFAAQGLYVWEWYVGARMPKEAMDALGWLAVAGGIAAWVAIDGAMIATVAGMRSGRRSPWSVLAIVVTAVFGAAVALNGHGELQDVGAWLHAGFAATITCYLLHLAAPRNEEAPVTPRPPRRGLRERLSAWWAGQQPAPAPLPATVRIADAGEAVYQAPSNSSNAEPARDYTCRHCGAGGLTKSEQLAHGRQHARERSQPVAG